MFLAITKRPRLIKFNFELKDFEKGVSFEIPFGFTLNHKKSQEDPSILIVRFSVSGGGAELPFELEIEIETRFSIKKNLKDGDLMKASFLEAGPVIFPVLNEYFTDLGRKADLPIDALPDVDFKEFYEIQKKFMTTDKK